jgi:bifunctional non-homologous end joining protein LigD
LSEVDLASRKRALKAILTGDGALANRGAVRYVHHFEGNGTELFAEVCRLGLAGIVCKLRTSRYRGGESTEWLEVRCLDRPAAAHHEKRLRLASLGTLRSARERARDSSEH